MLSLQQKLQLAEATDNYVRSNPISSFILDGNVIRGYFTYSFYLAKSYNEEPTRNNNGVIENLNAYPTFLTPSLKIGFKYLPIETYRTIMKLLYAKNEHIVTAYDPVYDKFVTHKMYFLPEKYPELFCKNYKVLAAINYEFEMVGTNADVELITVRYHKNDGSGASVGGVDVPNGTEIIVGQGINYPSNPPSGKTFKTWSQTPTLTEPRVTNGSAWTITKELAGADNTWDLYAIWEEKTIYTLSYNYGNGEIYEENHTPLYSKEIEINTPYNTLPTTSPKKVLYNNEAYDVYSNPKWYKTPIKAENSVPIKPTDKYIVEGNSTIYQIFDVKSSTISFDSQGGDYTPSSVTQEYGTKIYQPPTPRQEGKTFTGWWTAPTKGDRFVFNTMPPIDVKLYAQWR